MLLNELQKEHAKSEERNTNIATLTAAQKAKTAEIMALKATLQSQTAELTAMKRAQAEQQKLLAKLAAYIQSNKTISPAQKADFIQH